MKAQAMIDGGICGFHSKVRAESDDSQMVQLTLTSGCEKVAAFGQALAAKGPVDGYAEIGDGADGVVLTTARESLKGCCAACAVPIGVFKAMQVAAGVALPKDVSMRISSNDDA